MYWEKWFLNCANSARNLGILSHMVFSCLLIYWVELMSEKSRFTKWAKVKQTMPEKIVLLPSLVNYAFLLIN